MTNPAPAEAAGGVEQRQISDDSDNLALSLEEARKREDAFNKLTRLMISVRDFQEALSAATFLLGEVDNSINYPIAAIRRFRCYETTMVIAYARPFSMAKGEVGPLKWKDTGLSMTVVEKSLHKTLIKHRNTVYGHSDAEFVEMRVMVLHQPLEHNPVGHDWMMPRFEVKWTPDLGPLVKV